MNSLQDLLSDRATDFFDTTGTVLPTSPPIPMTPVEVVQSPAPSTPTAPPETNTQLKSMIYAMKDQLDAMLRLIDSHHSFTPHASGKTPDLAVQILDTGERIIEGVFSGEKMIAEDGKEYPIPPNYASKSKLVEGDMMKLTITKNGSFIYKQIGPIARKRIVGELVSPATHGHWIAVSEGKTYKILTASITFHKGQAGNQIILLVPENGSSDWAAVEMIMGA